jgi:hypothetical protein
LPTDTRLHALAKRGAELRLRELLKEASDLVKMFPPLKDAFDPDELAVKFLMRRGADKVALQAEAAAEATPSVLEPNLRRKRRWTAAQRKEAATRMKAYWAKRKRA